MAEGTQLMIHYGLVCYDEIEYVMAATFCQNNKIKYFSDYGDKIIYVCGIKGYREVLKFVKGNDILNYREGEM